jgi:ATP-binding cassette, subfamily B, bacterial PglK
MSSLLKQSQNYQLLLLWKFIGWRRQKQFFFILILIFLASLAEIVSIGSILPFLAVLTEPELTYQHKLLQPINKMFNIASPNQLMLPLTMLFICAILIAGLIRIAMLYAITKFSFATGSDLSIDIYRRTLYQDYRVHISRNSSEIINGIIIKTSTVIGGVITPILSLISSVVIMIAILITMVAIDSFVALFVIFVFGLMYFLVISYTKKRILENSKTIANLSTDLIKVLQEGLGGIRDVLIDGNQEFYCDFYRKTDAPLRKAKGDNQFITGAPRFVIEALGMTIIALVAYNLSIQEDGFNAIIPMLGALAIGAQRILPLLQLTYSSYTTLKGASSSFEDVISLLNQPLPHFASSPRKALTDDLMLFEKEIRLNNVNFRYDSSNDNQTSYVLKNINLVLKKGARIGFIGETGSGKSTLLDIIMGLLSPTSGELEIDGQVISAKNKRLWQAQVAHVPQNIFLSDATIEENIAFGFNKDEIDHKKIIAAARNAQLDKLIDSWRNGYQTNVGEGGVKLSGGQRQRIGLARALYKGTDILILDEATSALDNETEKLIMESIKGLGDNKTILVIAHRISTLKDCDQIIKLEKNSGLELLTYPELIEKHN